MTYNYLNDPYGIICLEQAQQGRTNVGFGAVCVVGGVVAGVGRNRRATADDRARLTHVDYAIHGEQAAILDAIDNGYDVTGADVYVLGQVLSGKNKGALTTRTVAQFGCKKCPHTFVRYGITIHVPHVDGWLALSPEDAMRTGKEFSGDYKWLRFSQGLITL